MIKSISSTACNLYMNVFILIMQESLTVCTFVRKRKQSYVFIGYLFLSGNAITTCKSNDKVKVLTVRGTAFEAAKTSGSGVASENGISLNNYDNKINILLSLG